MKRFFSIAFVSLFLFSINNFAQIPTNVLVQIVKAEDARHFDATLENFLKNPNPKIRERAVLALGRIGDEKSIPALSNLLTTEKDEQVRAMIAFAIGEIESPQGAETILKILQNETRESAKVLARGLEAAGKIAAANPKDESFKKLGTAILERLEFEDKKRSAAFEDVVLLGITAVLRARPEGGEKTVAEFLRYSNPRIRADALNTLSRLRAKSVNDKARELLAKDKDAIVRANAARVLGTAEDKEALEVLLHAATKDEDSRVRVSAIRSLGSLKDASVAEKLIPAATVTASNWARSKDCEIGEEIKHSKCNEFKSEYLEIAAVLGRLLPNTNNQKALRFLEIFRSIDSYESPESEIAFARIAPEKYVQEFAKLPSQEDAKILQTNHNPPSSIAQGLGELANSTDAQIKAQAQRILAQLLNEIPVHPYAISDVLTAYAAFKPDDLNQVLLKHLKHKDPIVRSNVAGLLGNQPFSKENFEALDKAFNYSFLNDKRDNDATLAILDALFKLNKKEAVSSLFTAAISQDYLVRKRAAQLMKDESYKDSDLVKITLDKFYAKKRNQVLPYQSAFKTKLGQVLNTNADYVRAVSRKNGKVKAVFTTVKGTFSIDLIPEDAPLTVDNFIKLAKSNYFNGLSVHRVVPNFVMQDGDPRGDGSGGPGWSIRCEVNMLSYERGAIGMALSGKDTGGSQWFATHSPQPHLDGGYTVFGKINETDMKIVDTIVRGDKILTVKIVGDSLQKITK